MNGNNAANDPGKKYSHAAVIVGQTSRWYKVKNSWGSGFADQGYFKFKIDAFGDNLKFLFIYHDHDDLTKKDLENWRNASKSVKGKWLATHYCPYKS